MYLSIKQAIEKASGKAELRGWIYNKRVKGKIAFIVLRDGTGLLQCVLDASKLGEKTIKEIDALDREASVILQGTLKKDKRALSGVELHVLKVKIVSDAKNYPITKKEHGPAFLLDHRHLTLRSPKYAAIMRVKELLMEGARDFFRKKDFIEIFPPIIVSTATEGGSTLFDMNYFGEKAYLSQSAQFYLEVLCYSLDRVYALTPSFRAEKSRTTRHLTEYWHLETEASWYGMEENLKLQEDLVKAMVFNVLKKGKKDLMFLERDVSKLEKAVKGGFQRITYKEAINILNKKGIKMTYGKDFGAKEERALSKNTIRPIFITSYPKEARVFYMKEDPKNKKLVLSNDLLAPEGFGEIITGSVREDDYNRLLARIKEQGYNPKDYSWYLDLRKYGSVPHSGFGLGLERTLAWVCGLEHIRDAAAFPRLVDRKYP